MSTTASSAAASDAATPTTRSSRPSPSPRSCKRPVKLVWTREEDTRQDKFRPHAVVAFKAGVGRRRNADRMVDARRHLVDLRFGRQAVPRHQSRAADRRRLGRQRLQRAEHARRSADQEHAPAGVVLARARRQPARLRHRELPRRDRVGERPRSLSGAAQAPRRQARLAQGAGYRRREGRLGQAVTERQRPRHRHLHGRRTASARRSPRSPSSRTAR